ncbi:endoplasmic reticulum retention protein [Kappamyces sp. JEL0829]|nr:endoplasmic reticulum retention protein [Kappamyces sp. JEL0829]KAJ3344444.1 endoplasmic reticulum retention protein [Kappamyces sp. JEL0680]
MNIFQLIADLMHLASIGILLLKMLTTRSAAGISFKSQALLAVVFLSRYLDLFTTFRSFYNSIMKVIFISTSLYICFLMKTRLKATWDEKLDTFRVEFLVVPCILLAVLVHYTTKHSVIKEMFWAFSIYLESVAILPQLFQVSRTGEAETITTHYLFALGAYRALYLLNWVYKYFNEPQWHDWIAVTAGLLQTCLYIDFFYIYVTK